MSDLFGPTMQLPREQRVIHAKCFHPSGRFTEFTRQDLDQSIPSRFEQIVARCPERLALKDEGELLTYRELNDFANRIARALLQQPLGADHPVALMFATGAPLTAATLAVLKVGKFFVLVDPSWPKARLINTLMDSQAELIVTSRADFSCAAEVADSRLLVVDLESMDAGPSPENLGHPISSQAHAALIYTSGSTGEPKGVLQNHRNVLHRVMVQTNLYHLCECDRISLLTSGTSNAVMYSFLALLNGAALLPFNVQKSGVLPLARFLQEEKITVCPISSPLFRGLLEALNGKVAFPELRLLRLTSETVHKSDVDLFKKHFSDNCVAVNILSCTESGPSRAIFFDQGSAINADPIPVGYPIEDKEVLILNPDGKRLGFNEIGEIAVRSAYLSSGYWQRPDLTRSKFISDPSGTRERMYLTGDRGFMLPDGCLVHVGRKDLRIKVRGYSVELEETENNLRRHPSIAECVVAPWSDKPGDQLLVAYCIMHTGRDFSPSELRSFLADCLPNYMIPTKFVALETLPLTRNGKIDRMALPKPDNKRPELKTAYVRAQDEIEKRMVGIWEEILDVQPIGIDDSFFDLGGHSLLAARLFARLDDEFGRLLPLGILVSSPTVRLVAERFRNSTDSEHFSPLVPFSQNGTAPAIFAVPGVYGNVVGLAELCRELGADQAFYGLQSIGLDGKEAPLDTIEDMARRYAEEMRKVQPRGPYTLVGACFGAAVTCEMAYQLLGAGEEISFLGLLDPIGLVMSQSRADLGSGSERIPTNNLLRSFMTGRLKLYCDEVRDLSKHGRVRFITDKIISLGQKLGDQKAIRAVRREIHQLAVFNASKLAGRRYRLKRLVGRLRTLEVFLSAHPRNAKIESFDWSRCWEGKTVLHHVPGKDSGDMLSGENARVLGALLGERLRATLSSQFRSVTPGVRPAQGSDASRQDA